MFWMFLANAIGMVTMFGLAFYLLLITQKGGFFGKARAFSSGFFCSFFGPAGRRPNNCSLWLPGRFLAASQKSRRTLRLFALLPSWYLAQLQLPGSGNELLFGYARIYQLIGLGVGVGIGLRSRCSVSDLLPGPWLQVLFERTIEKILRSKLLRSGRHITNIYYLKLALSAVLVL